MSDACDFVEFGPFRLDTARRLLARDGHPVPLSSRAFDILALLVEHRDRVMTKDDIITHVWRGVVVEENNLAVQVSALRRALGEAELEAPLILTVPGQGYRFVGRIAAPPAAVPAGAPPAAVPADPPPAAVPAGAPRAAVAAADPPAPVTIPERPVEAPRVAPPPPGRRWPLFAALAAGAVGATIVAAIWTRPAPPPPAPTPLPPPRLSIAVLPFRDLSDDRCCAYLADAVADDVTTDLSHIPGSVVIARESSDVYRNKTLPMAEIGRALNVRYVLEGSLRAVDENFAINAQLIEAASSAHLWAERFTVPRNHLGQAQDAIVHRIASALGVRLIQIEGSTAARERNSDPDALDLFFQARSILDRSDTLASINEAQAKLEQAMAEQPEFADGLAELALLLARKVIGVYDPNIGADLVEARRVGAAALHVAPQSARALAARGLLLIEDRQLEAARASFTAALATEPYSVPARSGLSQCLIELGLYDAAVPVLQELLRIDPEGPDTKRYYYRLGFAGLMLGRPSESLAWLARAGASGPEPAPGADELGVTEYIFLSRIAARQMVGDTGAARAELSRYTRIWPNRSAWQLGAAFTKAQSALPGFGRFIEALVAAGMPRTIDEHADMGVAPVDHLTPHRAFDPTPSTTPGSVAGLGTIDTGALQSRLATKPPPRIINLGTGAVTLPGTVPCTFHPAQPDEVAACVRLLQATPRAGPVVVMAAGATDWQGYNGALALARAGAGPVLWYRGGEESWAASGAAFTDTRP